MNKEVGEKYGLKHSFIINQWAAPDILLLCVTPPGIMEGTSGRSTEVFLWGASLSPLPHLPRWDMARPACLKITGWEAVR